MSDSQGILCAIIKYYLIICSAWVILVISEPIKGLWKMRTKMHKKLSVTIIHIVRKQTNGYWWI